MANQDRRPPPQSAEDMFGRPTDVRHDEDESQPTREQQTAHRIPRHEPEDAFHKRCEDEAEEEAAYGGVGEISDGDGVRSDRGTNPLPGFYWEAYPDKKPDQD
ncbi:hypothetical protein [Vitiosangium sp. GDMCC 1.1324]|uniref:hypothetical protein n=1 Tax=Vitiosangium sp. (strain GDMCC 1.1324) TaxID=2138576 RepID=UPI000D367907|nr:hypothetical protein [Vitiosangium sp. GDMCC 1.1324]PTL79556.1 hypothetical protein DAT35_32595 [Vitiosangium sp. GDMCC 1.1324]